jgi:YesN/AraC family two-component response regulator
MLEGGVLMLKMMLVDDEKTVLQGLSHILSKHCPYYKVVSMVQSAAEALTILQDVCIDVVITDVKMPDIDGIELTKKIRMLYPLTEVVVLSGYDDFEFVRQTMKNGACDYLLKPCNYQSILDILLKLEKALTQRDNKALISGKQELPEKYAEYDNMKMAVVSVQGCADAGFEEHLTQELMKGNMAKEFLEMIAIDEKIVILFRHSMDLSTVKQRFYGYRQSLNQKGYITYWTISDCCRGPKCLKQAYDFCVQMIEFLQFNEMSMVLDKELYQKYLDRQKTQTISDYFSNETLGKYILNGDIQKIQHIIEKKWNQLYRSDCYWDPNQLKSDVLKELLYLEHQMKDHGLRLQPICGDLADYIEKVKLLRTFRHLLDWLKNYILIIISNLHGEGVSPQYIHVVRKYIETHYMEDICLKTVSDTVFLNPWYFSSQFKKYMNITFSEYLNQVRVRMAKQFLRQKDLKVYQVAEMVGFQDAAYFSTVFKNVENMSPKDFQKTVS